MGVVKRQGIKNAISSYLGILIGFVSLVVIQPKFLSPEIIGLCRALFALSAMLSALIPLGSSSIIIKYFPKFFDREKKHHGFLGFILLYSLVGSFVTFGLLLLFKSTIIAKYSVHSALFDDYFFWVFPLSFCVGLQFVFSAYLGSIYKSTIPSYLNDIVVRLLYVALIFLFYFQWLTLAWFVAGYVLIYALQIVVLAVYLAWEDRPTLRFSLRKMNEESISEMTKFGLVAWAASFTGIGLNNVDAVILGAYGLSNLGIYTIVAFVPTVIQTPLIALDRISASKIGFALAENDTNTVQEIYYKSCRYLAIIGGFLTVAINVNIASLLQFVKPEFLAALPIVPIVSIGYLLNMANGTSTTILLYGGKKWEAGFFLSIAFVITIILDLLLIPRLGMKGAAVSIAVTALIYDTVKWLWLWKKMNLQPYNFSFVKLAVLIAAIWLIGTWIPDFSNPVGNIFFKGTLVTIAYISGILSWNILPEWKTFLPEKIRKKLP